MHEADQVPYLFDLDRCVFGFDPAQVRMGQRPRVSLGVLPEQPQHEAAGEQRLAPTPRPVDQDRVRRAFPFPHPFEALRGPGKPVRQRHPSASTKRARCRTIRSATSVSARLASMVRTRGAERASSW